MKDKVKRAKVGRPRKEGATLGRNVATSITVADGKRLDRLAGAGGVSRFLREALLEKMDRDQAKA